MVGNQYTSSKGMRPSPMHTNSRKVTGETEDQERQILRGGGQIGMMLAAVWESGRGGEGKTVNHLTKMSS